MLEKIEKLQTLIVGAIVVLAILIGAKIISSSMSQNVITVTGSASQVVKSDSGRVELKINIQNSSKQVALSNLKKQAEVVKKYLQDKKITDIEIKPSYSYAVYKKDSRGYDTQAIDYHVINQSIIAKSNNVELIKEISTDVTNLIDKGIDVNAYDPTYNYSKLADLKVELLEKASKDAKERANSMLKPTRNSAGKIKNVRMGVYQITPVDSTDVSDNGINDTSTIDKKVTAVANVSFRIK